TDQVDVNFKVKERQTGNLSLGVGFSSADSVVLSAAVAQQNLFGSGNALNLQLNTSASTRTYSLSYTNPYYTVDGVSRGFDVYHRTYDADALDLARYKTASTGFGLRYGFPIAEDDRINVGLTIDRTEVTTFDDSPVQYKDFVTAFGNEATSLLGSISWSRDGRDSLIYPRKGMYQRAFMEVAIPPAELRYVKASYQHQYWLPIGQDSAFMVNGEVGWAVGYGGKPLPFFKNFYAGGIGSIRGFKQSSLGPRILNTDGDLDAVGGNRRLIANAEYYFPLPGTGRDRSFRLSAFFDAGNVWGQDEKLEFSELRYSAGLGFSWSSPIGPLKLSVGFPLKKQEDDKIQRFQFQLGSVF
ncbi:MAG TPA: outer membrane protein assembly factor BamA, partial [Denitromonas sp.]|nr:outer membrane protein assembly factor BamA [Denitromonas sp.]